MSPGLSPCPFCGGPGKVYSDYQGREKIWRVMCGARVDCALLLNHFKTEADAITAWNTRAVDRTLGLFEKEN